MRYALSLLALCGCLLGCASPELELSEVALGPAQTRCIRIQERGSDRAGPEMILTRDIWAFGLARHSDGVQVFSWSGLGQDHEYTVELRSDGGLQLSNVLNAQGLGVGPREQLYLQAPGPYVASLEAEREARLPALANCPFYLGLDLVNSAPQATFPRGSVVQIAAVAKDSPGAASGLQVGDVLLRATCGSLTHELRSRQAFAAWVAELAPGNTLDLQVQRGAESLSVKISGGTRALNQFRAPESVSDAREFLLSH